MSCDVARRKPLTRHRGAALRGRLDDRLVDFDIVDTVGKAGRGLAHSFGFAKDVALSPDGVEDTARAGDFQLATELADEDVDDLRLRLVHAAVEVAQERRLAEDRSLAKRQELDNPEFLAGQRKSCRQSAPDGDSGRLQGCRRKRWRSCGRGCAV